MRSNPTRQRRAPLPHKRWYHVITPYITGSSAKTLSVAFFVCVLHLCLQLTALFAMPISAIPPTAASMNSTLENKDFISLAIHEPLPGVGEWYWGVLGDRRTSYNLYQMCFDGACQPLFFRDVNLFGDMCIRSGYDANAAAASIVQLALAALFLSAGLFGLLLFALMVRHAPANRGIGKGFGGSPHFYVTLLATIVAFVVLVLQLVAISEFVAAIKTLWFCNDGLCSVLQSYATRGFCVEGYGKGAFIYFGSAAGPALVTVLAAMRVVGMVRRNRRLHRRERYTQTSDKAVGTLDEYAVISALDGLPLVDSSTGHRGNTRILVGSPPTLAGAAIVSPTRRPSSSAAARRAHEESAAVLAAGGGELPSTDKQARVAFLTGPAGLREPFEEPSPPSLRTRLASLWPFGGARRRTGEGRGATTSNRDMDFVGSQHTTPGALRLTMGSPSEATIDRMNAFYDDNRGRDSRRTSMLVDSIHPSDHLRHLPSPRSPTHRRALPLADSRDARREDLGFPTSPRSPRGGAYGGYGYANPSAVDTHADGDWVLEPQSGMLWSDQHRLFLNTRNGHFYDPDSDHWYDPERQLWFAA